MFCMKCGTKLPDGSRFCTKCGNRVDTQAPPQAPAAFAAAPQQPPRLPFDFSRIPVRYRCPNGHVFDSAEGETVCRTCGAPLPPGGLIQIYRMGNMMGVAVGMGIQINGVGYGYLANKQSIRLHVPYGANKVHVTHTATRLCNDPVFNITPQAPYVFCKASFVSGGFKINVEPSAPESMPTE